MGVVYGRPLLADGVDPFVNLPREAMESLWTSYNLLGEGWSLSIEDVRNIFSGAAYVTEKVGFNDDNLKALFTVFDTDKNNLIDALELFTTLAVASGMDTIDKISFVFAAFDLGGRESLSFDGGSNLYLFCNCHWRCSILLTWNTHLILTTELTLLLRSCVIGLAKLCPNSAPLQAFPKDAEAFVPLIYSSAVS